MNEKDEIEKLITFLRGLNRLEALGLGDKKLNEIDIDKLEIGEDQKKVIKEMLDKAEDKTVSEIIKETKIKLFKREKKELKEIGEIMNMEWSNIV